MHFFTTYPSRRAALARGVAALEFAIALCVVVAVVGFALHRLVPLQKAGENVATRAKSQQAQVAASVACAMAQAQAGQRDALTTADPESSAPTLKPGTASSGSSPSPSCSTPTP